jgi:polyisoprenoid-binding protein YceI
MSLRPVGLVLAVSAGLLAQQNWLDPDLRYVVDPKDSRIEFVVHSSLTRMDGVFPKWQAEFKVPSPRMDECSFKLRVMNASATTGIDAKDRLVKSERFLWVQRFPSIDFVSRRITPDPADPLKFHIDGDFTMRGITKPVSLQLMLEADGNPHGTVSGDLSFDRREFGMPDEMPFKRVSDSVRVRFDLDVVAMPPEQQRSARGSRDNTR